MGVECAPPATNVAGVGLIFLAGLEIAAARLRLPASPIAHTKINSSLVCRLTNECVEYAVTLSSPIQAADNATLDSLDSLTSMYLDLNFVGKYNETLDDRPNRNVCMNGKIAPTFFLLGAQKSATTNFAARFTQVALSAIPPKPKSSEPGYFTKELHLFDVKGRARALGLDGWLSYYPACTHSVRAVGMDATPSYISSPIAPSLMRAWYKGLSSKLQFLVLLRSPLYRMRSSFYHATEHRGCKRNQHLCGSFGEYISAALANNRAGCPSGEYYPTAAALAMCANRDGIQEGGAGDPFHLSRYVPQLQRWTAIFNADQFVIAPFLSYVAPSPHAPKLVLFMAKRIGSAVKSFTYAGPIPRGMAKAGKAHKYPSLQKDISSLNKEDTDALGKMLETDAGPAAIAKVLAPKMEQGLVLFGYKGPRSNETAINLYIQSNW